jgi:hypothetical protein
MNKTLCQFLASIAIASAPILSFAEIPKESADLLMKASRMDVALEGVAVQLYNGMESEVAGEKVDPEIMSRLKKLTNESYGAEILQRETTAQLADRIAPNDFTEAMRWYKSPLGKKSAQMEIDFDAAILDKGYDTMLNMGSKSLAAATPKRLMLITNLMNSIKLVEYSVNLQIHTALGIYQGLSTVAANQAGPSLSELRESLEKQRPKMQSATIGTSLAYLAGAYEKLSDTELNKCLAFLTTPAGMRVQAIQMASVEYALVRAASLMGKGLAEIKKPNDL